MLKRLWSILLCLFLLSALFIPVSAAESEEEPAIQVRKIEISTPEEFLAFAENCRLDSFSQNLEVYLTEDIDLTGYAFEGVPVFSGTFWGKHHCISGISVTADGSNKGMFRYLTESAVVQDLTVEGVIQPGGSRGNVGAVAGTNSGQIRNCKFAGTVAGGDCVGGIVGENTVTGVLENCSTAGEVYGDHFVGGITGRNYGVIRNSENEAQINITPQQNTVEISDITLQTITNSEAVNTVTDIGGIAGISSGVIRDSINHGAVGYRQMGYNIGGIAGTQSGYITDCKNFGRIQGRKEVGGIVGQMEPVSVVEFSKDTLQILKDQLIAMTGMVNQASVNAQNNANQITDKIGVLQNQAQTAKDAVTALFPSADSPKLPDVDTILAAQSTLTKTMAAMPGTMRSIASAAHTTVSGLSKDMNTLSAQIGAMGYTLENDYKNLGGSITDISDQDTSDLLIGKVENSVNAGAVLADLNAGGIAGAIAVENDLDFTENLEQLGEVSLNFNSEVRAVILSCENSGTVTGNKQNAGGIVGWQTLGLVKLCTNTGYVDAANADHVGGICGTGSGFVRNCYANCALSGDTYVGGIAGSGVIVTDCRTHVKFSGGRERIGAILGWAEKPLSETENPISGNYYLPVETDWGAVDGISYAGQAEALAQEAFLSLPDLPDIFKTASVSFCFVDGAVKTLQVPVGGTLKDSQIPEIPLKYGFSGKWAGLEEADLSNIVFDLRFEAEYTALNTVIESDHKRSDGRPILLLEGSFTDTAEATVSKSNEIPVLQGKETAVESWVINVTETGSTARFLIPDPETSAEWKLYACENDGQWQEILSQRKGSYLVFAMETEQMQIALVQVNQDFTLWIVTIAAALMVVLLTLVFVIIKRKRKVQASE